jgi:hypothetical protein
VINVNEAELMKMAERLARIYRLSDTDPKSIDPYEKERLYALASQYPEIHYAALEINDARFKSR